ncbi:MAG: hypothetical protein J0L82_15330 [Deltaproteobacteria bacterium]|jgi:Ca2+-binding EF-hand superfamily protein|nr:hypothetical protein [Deltaproteobacteria bacterium]
MKLKSNTKVRLALSMCALILGAVMTLGGCAIAPKSVAQGEVMSPEGDAQRMFEVLDVNGDGLVSKAEAKSGLQYLVASYDRGGKTEILAAKQGADGKSKPVKRKSKRKPTSQDAEKAFEALFAEPTKVGNGLTQDEFKTLVVKASDNPESDPFAAFF